MLLTPLVQHWDDGHVFHIRAEDRTRVLMLGQHALCSLDQVLTQSWCCCIFEPPEAPDFSFHLEILDYLIRNFIKWEGLARNGIYVCRPPEEITLFLGSGSEHPSASRCLSSLRHRNVSTLKAGTEAGWPRCALLGFHWSWVCVCSCTHT